MILIFFNASQGFCLINLLFFNPGETFEIQGRSLALLRQSIAEHAGESI